MGVPVVLVDVVDRVGVDDGRADLGDDALDERCRRVAFTDPGVLEVLDDEPCPEDRRGRLGLVSPHDRIATPATT